MKKVCYTVVLQSQLGPRAGELLLMEDTQAVSGELCLLGRRNRFSGSGGLVTRHGCWDLTGVEVPSSAQKAEPSAAAGG